MSPTQSLLALLSNVVDYAGLYPPAALGMEAAVTNYARYVAGPDRWMLGRFVLPATRLDEFEVAAATLVPAALARPWQLSGLLGADLVADLYRIAKFNDRWAGRAVVDAVELRALTPSDIRAAAAALDVGLARGSEAYVEIPLDGDPAPMIAAIRAAGLRAKVRTGGVTSIAFPTSDALAAFLVGCARVDVVLKATAGLHHPLRAEYRLTYADDAPSSTMFGFVNVFVAAALARSGASADTVREVLEERDPAAFSFDDFGASWRDVRLGVTDLRAARAHAQAFGSCSFDEPTSELKAIGWL